MLALRNPAEAYRRVDFEARVAGADTRQLVALCYERLDVALGSALHAHTRGDNRAKSEALTRAVSALTALQMGVAGDAGVAGALQQFYEAARRRLLDNVVTFDPATIATVRKDIADIAEALVGAGN